MTPWYVKVLWEDLLQAAGLNVASVDSGWGCHEWGTVEMLCELWALLLRSPTVLCWQTAIETPLFALNCVFKHSAMNSGPKPFGE